MSYQGQGAKTPIFKRLCFSKTLLCKNHSHKVAYIAVTTAFTVVVNMLEIKLGGIQFSLTIFVAAFAGLLLGGVSGFGACFIGDLIGFLIHPFGEYSPWIGISTGLMAFFAAVFLLLPNAKKWLPLYLSLACVCIFACCTCGVTTLYLNKVCYKGMTFWECLIMRLFVQGQVWNSLVNSVLTVALLPLAVKIKPLKLIL
ncbi:MAG: ECF transporter S component [Clostridia bacterium]|nr:ECF transporter S component [Clostridia bacterium]